jgi:micrococcal nuclease
MKPFRIILPLILILLFVSTVFTQSGKVVGVSDGDTITVLVNKTQVKVRLYGIDCPENGQDFGARAKQFASQMVLGRSLPWKFMTPTNTAGLSPISWSMENP